MMVLKYMLVDAMEPLTCGTRASWEKPAETLQDC